MSFWGMLTGGDAADAAKSAAADTYAKQQKAVQGITDYGNTYAQQYKGLSQAYDPYVRTGNTATTALQSLMQDPSSVRQLPGYQFAMDEGLKGLDRSAAARGMLDSGRAGKDVMKYATGYADQTYGDQYNRLLQGSQQGLGATSAQVGAVGQGLQGQLGTQQSAYQGNMRSAGTIGQGDVAAAQAQQNAFNNILGLTGTLGGAALGGNFGNSLLGKMFGGSTSSYTPAQQANNWGGYNTTGIPGY